MTDAVAVFQFLGNLAQESIARVPLRHYEMGDQRGLGGAHRPDVEVVHARHPRQGGNVAAHRVHLDPLRDGVEAQDHAVLQKAPCAPGDNRHDCQADQRIDHRQAGCQDRQPRQHHANRNQRICRHVEEGAANVDVVLAAAHEHQRRGGVDDDAQARNPHHRPALRLHRIEQAADRLVGDRPDRQQQQHRIGERGEDGGALQSPGESPGRRLARGKAGRPGDQQGQHVRQVVTCIRDQRHRVGEDPEGRLHHHKATVQRHAEGKSAVMAAGRMGMVSMPMSMSVIVRMRVRAPHAAIRRRRHQGHHA
jgi:hypothetical protein